VNASESLPLSAEVCFALNSSLIHVFSTCSAAFRILKRVIRGSRDAPVSSPRTAFDELIAVTIIDRRICAVPTRHNYRFVTSGTECSNKDSLCLVNSKEIIAFVSTFDSARGVNYHVSGAPVGARTPDLNTVHTSSNHFFRSKLFFQTEIDGHTFPDKFWSFEPDRRVVTNRGHTHSVLASGLV